MDRCPGTESSNGRVSQVTNGFFFPLPPPSNIDQSAQRICRAVRSPGADAGLCILDEARPTVGLGEVLLRDSLGFRQERRRLVDRMKVGPTEVRQSLRRAKCESRQSGGPVACCDEAQNAPFHPADKESAAVSSCLSLQGGGKTCSPRARLLSRSCSEARPTFRCSAD